MKSFLFALSLVLGALVFDLANAQDPFLEEKPIFKRHDLDLKGRLRQLTLEEVFPGGKQQIVVMEREGTYPDWRLSLTVWGESKLLSEIRLPSDVLLYAFHRRERGETSALLLLRPGQLELWTPRTEGGKTVWKADPRYVWKSDFAVSAFQPGHAEPFRPALSDGILIPATDGFAFLGITPKGFEFRWKIPVPPKLFVRSSSERMPFELPFWTRISLFHPAFVPGSLTAAKPADSLFFPWMDEVTVASFPKEGEVRTFSFHQLTEAEREDAQSYVVTTPEDLDGDGRMDFVVNKFQGEAASLRAETNLFLTGKDGGIPSSGIPLTPRGNRTAGALPLDLNRDGKKDLVVASSQFNAWSVVKALVQNQADVNFAFYYFHPDGYHLDRPDFEREISFRFNLTDLAIDGMLPTMEGDFNGDGYPDALYARDRKRLTVLIQKPGAKEPFAAVPSGTYDVQVPRLWRVGDVNGDGKSDVVLYDRRSSGNRRVTLLLNAGRLK